MHPYSQKQIIEYLQRIGAQYQDAEDVAQEVLISLFENPPAKFHWGYVAKMAKHRWIDSLRRQARIRLVDDMTDTPQEESEPEPDHSLLHASIEKLTPPLKRAINDRFWLKRSHKESAAAHGISEQSQRNNVQRAKAKLHQLMT